MNISRFSTSLVLLLTIAASPSEKAPDSDFAFHKSGQTFITWQESRQVSGELYNIYRHKSPLPKSGFNESNFLAAISENSSWFREMHNRDGTKVNRKNTPEYQNSVIERFVIKSVARGKGKELDSTTGLFVWTVKEKNITSYYTIVTYIQKKRRRKYLDTLTFGPIKESFAPIEPVRYYVGKDRDFYIMWLDYRLFKGNRFGYAFPFAITRKSFKRGGKMPTMHLDGIGTTVLSTSNYSNFGAGDLSGNGSPTWYFGYKKSKMNNVQSKTEQDTIANYMQFRIIQVILWTRRHFQIKDPRFHINGNSMGASGALGFLTKFPSLVTSVWANQAITKYDSVYNAEGKLMWHQSMHSNYGKPSLKNPVKFLPFSEPKNRHLNWAARFNGKNIYDIRNVVEFLKLNMHKSFGCLSAGHTFDDGSIPFESQAKPFEAYIRNSRQCFSYGVSPGSHNWGSAFNGNIMNKFMRWDESRPGFSNVPPISSCKFNDPKHEKPNSRTYMAWVKWGVKDKPLSGGKKIEETSTSWSIPIINTSRCSTNAQEYKVDITPRNLQKLKICKQDKFRYTVSDLNSSKTESHGTITADSNQLLLIPSVPIRLSGALAKVVLYKRGPHFPCKRKDDF